MISKKIFVTDGKADRFLSDFIIRDDQFCRVYNYTVDIRFPHNYYNPHNGLYNRLNNIPVPDEDLVTVENYDIIDSSVAFYNPPYPKSHIYIEVATTPEEFGDTLTAPAANKAFFWMMKAHDWAVNPEWEYVYDTVNPIDYSAYHWAMRAKETVDTQGYYLRDGTLPLTAPLNAGFHRLAHIGKARSKWDAVQYNQMIDYAYSKNEFIQESVGTYDGFSPIITDVFGKIHPSLFEVTAFIYQGSWTPRPSDEYPTDPELQPGDFYDIYGVDEDNGYTFLDGTLKGKIAYNGDILLRSESILWTLRDGPEFLPSEFYRLDGLQPITAPFEAGGQRLRNLADGVDTQDAVTMYQLRNAEYDDRYLRIDGFNKMEADIKMSDSYNIVGLREPVTEGEATNKRYVDKKIIDVYTYMLDKYNNVYTKNDFVSFNNGIDDISYKPITLNGQGQISESFLKADALYFVAGFTPTPGAEYPDTSFETPGAYWIVQNVDELEGYTYTTGDLANQTAKNGSLQLWGTGGWVLYGDAVNPNLFLRLDGTKPMEAPINMDNNNITHLAAGSQNDHAATFGQVDIKVDQGDFDNHVGDSSNPHNVTYSQVGSPNGSWTWDGTNLIITIP